MISEHLQTRFNEIERLARAAGLRPYDVHFFQVPSSVICEIASYGLPTRYSHWSFGKIYENQKRSEEMGQSKIYELILSNNPAYAFLDKNNTDTANLLVAAHVLGHSDVFANNVMFRECGETNMIAVAKRHAEAIDNYRKEYGDEEVDFALDIALALERHIDVHHGFRRKRYAKRHVEYQERTPKEWEDLLDTEPEPLVKRVMKGLYLPPHLEKDLLWFLSEYSNLEPWQKRIFEIVRRESYYFYAQFRTKVLHEGWACVAGNTRIHTKSGLIKASDIISQKHNNTSITASAHLFEKRSDVYITERKKGLQIWTNRGLVFTCALNHKIQLSDGSFCPACQLKVGSRLQLCISHQWSKSIQYIKCSYRPSKYAHKNITTIGRVVMDEELSRFIAFWLGEGSQGEKRTTIVRNSKLKDLRFFGKYIKKTFGINYAIFEVKDGGTKRYDLVLHSRAFFELLNDVTGDATATSRFKRVPDYIFKSPKKVVVSFLRSFFDAEGCVRLKSKTLVIASSSIDIISEIALLLQCFDIYCSFGRSKKKDYKDGYQLIIVDKQSVLNFNCFIGCNDTDKSKKLHKLIKTINTKSHWQKRRQYAKVKEIHPVVDVFYDFTMPQSHQYVANGLIHHNSFWHAELMKQYFLGNENDYGVKDIEYPLTSEEHLDFAIMHEKVVQAGPKVHMKQEVIDPKTGKKVSVWNPIFQQNPGLFSRITRLNPYYVGFKMFRDIKERWDEYYEQGYREDEWDQKIPVTINGDQKIREVMMENDDVSFFRNYLTEDLCEKLHLFAWGNTEKFDDNYAVQENDLTKPDNEDKPMSEQLVENKTLIVRSKEVQRVINSLALTRNNYGVPCIAIRRVDESGLLRLEHITDDKINVDIKYAEHVLKYVNKVWCRPVEMVRKEKDRTWIMKYDGISFEIDYDNPDYPKSIEEGAPPSSW